MFGRQSLGVPFVIAVAVLGCDSACWRASDESHVTDEPHDILIPLNDGMIVPCKADTRALTLVKDFGVVSPNKPLRLNFALRNTTGATWVPNEIQTSCSCVAAAGTMQKSGVTPNALMPIAIELVSGDTEADSRQKVVITFAGQDGPTVTVLLHARTRKPMSVSTQLLDFPAVCADNASRQSTLVVENHSGDSWGELRAEEACEWLTVNTTRISSPGAAPDQSHALEAWNVFASIIPDALPIGVQNASITLVATDADRHFDTIRQDVSVSARRRSTLIIVPSVLFFGEVNRDGVAECDVRIYAPMGEVLGGGLQAAVSDNLNSEMSVTVVSPEPGDMRLQAKFAPKMSAGLREGFVTLTTGRSSESPVLVPVSVWVKD
jgi:hypothetical protein